MDNVSAWEQLQEVVERVAAARALSKDWAKAAICGAIADRTVKVRAKLKRHASNGLRAAGTVLEGKDFNIPTEIGPADLDWEQSCPLGAWVVRRGGSEPPGLWYLERIELRRADVTDVLCAGRLDKSPLPVLKGLKARRRPKLEHVEGVLQELYSEGVPDQAAEPNAVLCRRVAHEIEKHGFPPVSDDTILRAAGRRS